MNENQLYKVKKGVQEVLDKMEIQAVTDPEQDKMFFADIETAAADGMMMNVHMYLTIKDHNGMVALEMEDEIDEDKIVPVMELVSLINRQTIVGHLFVHLRDKIVFFKKDIILVNDRLNKTELEWSINHLLDNVAFYSLDIRELINSNKTLDEREKSSWLKSSYLHGECRSDEQV
jgi:hypothetical protein